MYGVEVGPTGTETEVMGTDTGGGTMVTGGMTQVEVWLPVTTMVLVWVIEVVVPLMVVGTTGQVVVVQVVQMVVQVVWGGTVTVGPQPPVQVTTVEVVMVLVEVTGEVTGTEPLV
jgi:hypothetical protein